MGTPGRFLVFVKAGGYTALQPLFINQAANLSFPEVTKGLTRHQLCRFIAQIDYNQRS
jgi:hypothetical protein